MAFVSEKAFGVGATAIPGPLTEIEWEGWLFHQQGVLKSPTGTIADMGSARVQNFVIDAKAMRKTGTQSVCVAVIEVAEVGTATMHAEFRSRQLFKLP